MYRMSTNRGNYYTLDDDGYVVARSNGPKGWDYKRGWRIVGLSKRHHSRHIIPLDIVAVRGADFGHGIVHDWDHGYFRTWGNERVTAIWRVAE